MKTAVIGGGPGGMTAAVSAAVHGDDVVLFEQNEKLGKKLYITGKGRCNLTNACGREIFFENVMHHPRFVYSAFAAFSNHDLMTMIEEAGCPLKTERGNRVFPQSDKSSDIIKAFGRLLTQHNVDVRLNTKIRRLLTDDDRSSVIGVETAGCSQYYFDRVIMATGGLTYPSTGSDGSGLKMAAALSHRITACRPSLVGLKTVETWPMQLQGLSLKNVAVTLYKQKKKISREQGEMLFTHFGVSGPMILSHSARMDGDPKDYHLVIDLKPALDETQVDQRLLKDFELFKNKQLINGLSKILPSMMIPVFIGLCRIDETKRINQIDKRERRRIALLLKNIEINIDDFYSMESAIVTSGGIDTKMIDAKTMASKKIKGLYFAGEMIDIDAMTGGFNIQLAASTGWLAGKGEESCR